MMKQGVMLGALDVPAPEREDAQGAPAVAAVVPVGFFAVFRAIRKARTLTSTERLVLFLIAGSVDARTGTAAIGIPALAEDSDFKERTIERTIATLLQPRPGFEPAAWLVKLPELSIWGTNLYRVTPIPGDTRPTKERKRIPPTHGRGSAGNPRHTVGGESGSSDRGSWTPPIEDRGPPRSSIGPSPSSSPGSSAQRERGESPPPSDLVDLKKQKILSFLSGHASLRSIAVAEVVNAIADEGRPLDVVRAALDELAADAATARAVGEPMSASTLAKKARTYVRDNRMKDREAQPQRREPDPPEPPPEPPLPITAETRERLSALVTNLGGFPPKTTGPDPKGSTWEPPMKRK